MLAGQVFAKIRPLVDDDIIDFTTVDYLVPRLQLALDRLVQDLLNNPNMGSLKTVVVLPNVPLGTTSLANYFNPNDASGGPLALLSDIISLRERPSQGSRNEQDWVEMDPVPNLPAMQPTAFNRVYVWTLEDIKILGADQAVDIRVFGKFTPVAIQDEQTAIPPNTDAILAYRTASIIAKSRGNAQLGQDYAATAKELMDSLLANTIMNQQAMRVRMKPFRTFSYPYR